MQLMEQSCIRLIPDAAPNDTLITPRLFSSVRYLVTSALQPKLSAKQPHPHLFFHSDHPIWLPPELLVVQNKERFKESQGIISTGEKRDLAVALSDAQWTDGLQDSLARKCSSELQDGVETSTTVQSKGSRMAPNEERGQTRGKRGLKPRAEMILLGEYTLWTPLLKGLKASYCLSKTSSGHMPESGPKRHRAALILIAQILLKTHI